MAERLAATRLPRRSAAQAWTEEAPDLEGVLGSRVFAYLIDSLILIIVSIACVSIGALNLLIQSDWGNIDAPDSALWAFVYISLAAVPAWSLISLVLLARRGQTVGQYIVGLRVVRENGDDAGILRLLLYLLALHPLIFHPVLAIFWALLAYIALSLTSSTPLVLASLAIALLCVAGPFVALLVSAANSGWRGLHDRIAGTMVVRLE